MGALRHLMAASGLSNLADGVVQVALPIATLSITREPSAFAAVTFAVRLPWLVFTLPAGVVIDRLDRRRTMLQANLFRSVVLGGFAVVLGLGHRSIWLVCLIAVVVGSGETLFDTASQSLVPRLVPPAVLARANARLYGVELTTNQLVGPVLGGFVAATTMVGTVGGVAIAYGSAAAALVGLRGSYLPTRPGSGEPDVRDEGSDPAAGADRADGADRAARRADPRRSLRGEIAEGLRYLAGHRQLRLFAVVVGIANLAATATLAVFPLYAIDPGPMGLSEAGYGILLASGAAGAVLGTFFVPAAERLLGPRAALLIAFVGFAVLLGVPGITASVAAVGATYFLAGFCLIAWNVITVSFRQRIVPDHLLGRVNAAYRMVAWGTMPLGAAFGGAVGSLVGLRGVFVLATLACLVSLPWLVVVLSSQLWRPS